MNETTPPSLHVVTSNQFSHSGPPPNTPANPRAKPQQVPRPNRHANWRENVETPKQFVNGGQDTLYDESQQVSWPSSVFSFVGDIAGKAWQFARDSAFSGFFAGGGDGYVLTDSSPRRVPSFNSVRFMPGHFPMDDIDNEQEHPPRFVDHRKRHTTKYERANGGSFIKTADSWSDEEPRPPKRQQVSQGEHWSVVNPYPQRFQRRRTGSALQFPSEHHARRRTVSPRMARPNTAASETSFSSRRSKPSAARLSSPRLVSNNGAHSPLPRHETNRPASSASTRSPKTTTPLGSPARRRKRPSPSSHHDNDNDDPNDYDAEDNANKPHGAQSTTTDSLPTPRGEKRKANSTAPSPARNSMPTSTSASNSPSAMAAAQDAQRYAAKRQREERRAEKSISRLEAQMQDMIRKGREALASRVEVEEDDGEIDGVGEWDGYVDGEEGDAFYEEEGGEAW